MCEVTNGRLIVIPTDEFPWELPTKNPPRERVPKPRRKPARARPSLRHKLSART